MKLLTNRADIWLFVYERFGIRLGHTAFTQGHSTPLDFVADALVNSGDDIAAWSCRSGGKTLGSSIIAAVEFLHHDNALSFDSVFTDKTISNFCRPFRCSAIYTGRKTLLARLVR